MNLDEAIRKVLIPKAGDSFLRCHQYFHQPAGFRYCVDSMLELYKGESIDGVI
jgi:adenine/guanine phosphoribosyltransferase-like PRPP-binding protein